ncbi:MAG: helix-turn-helix domain-containing protein [Oscillospiraceae bacterium]|nr:helix-turn-helix domain-containing protein [Oscillospiraceae bacterium]MBR2422035.1 helix-turn-helix domain-containing protein [Oscillospiraceae bacterium]
MSKQSSVMDARRPGYYAVIPADVRYDDRLPANAKLLYGEIAALITAEGYCFASNAYFAWIYKLSERTVSSLIGKLQEYKYIDVELKKDPKTGQVIKRLIYLKVSSCDGRPLAEIFYTPRKYFQEGIENFFQDTNLSNTDILKENKKEKPKSERASPLTDEQLQQMFVDWIKPFGWSKDEKNGVYLALVGFYSPREKKKQEPARTQAGFTALSGNLSRYSEGKPSVMIELLNRATSSGWKSVFPLNGGNGSKQQEQRKEERQYKCL